jgi:hypothetical protein
LGKWALGHQIERVFFRFEQTTGCWKTGTYLNPPHDADFLLGLGFDETTANLTAPFISAVDPTAQIEVCLIKHPKNSGQTFQMSALLLLFGLSLVFAQF